MVWTPPSARWSAMGQLSGMALTTYFMPACSAACAGQTCVPMTGISFGTFANTGAISSAFFWSLAL